MKDIKELKKLPQREMKTLMQELIDELKELQETQDPYTLQDAIELAESMLKKEKKVLENAYDNGFSDFGLQYPTFNKK